MPWCEQCGSKVTAQARFCSGCGRAVAVPEGDAEAAAIGDPTPSPEAVEDLGVPAPLLAAELPRWITVDWPVAAVAALIVLGVCLAVAVVYGALAGAIATGHAAGLVSGALAGAYLVFAMFGIATEAVRYAGDATVHLSFKTFPLPLAVTVLLGVYAALRFAWPRIGRQREELVAFVVKLALVVTVLTAMLAALLGFGDLGQPGADGDAFAAHVAIGPAAFYPFVLVALLGAAILSRRERHLGGRVARAISSDVGRAAVLGALAFLAIAAVLAVVVLAADVAVASDGRERATTAVAFFATGLNRGVAASVFAMGGAVERFVSHTSLFHWGSYQHPGATTAPLPLFAWLGLAPAAVAYAALRSLDRERPAGEQGVARVAAGVIAGFVAASFVLVEITGQDRVAAGSPRAAFGLALFWAVLAVSAASALWARSHGVRWQSLHPDAPAAGEPPEQPHAPEPSPTLIDPDA